MAKQVQPLEIILGIKGAEKLAALKSSFRDLTKTVKQSDADIESARKSINNYVKSANNSEAVIRGQIKAFEGLREQAAMGGKVYSDLSNNINKLQSTLRGSSDAVERQRESLIRLGGASKSSADELRLVIGQLEKLKSKVREDSAAFSQLNKDITKLNTTLKEIETSAGKARFAISAILSAKPEKITGQIEKLSAAIASGKLEAEDLNLALRKLELLRVGAGRGPVAFRADVFSSQLGVDYFARLRKEYDNLEKTQAAITQRISEVNTELRNVTGYERRRSLTLELIRLNKELQQSIVDVTTREQFQAMAIRQRMGRARETYAASGFGEFSAEIRQRTAGGEFTPGMQRARERARNQIINEEAVKATTDIFNTWGQAYGRIEDAARAHKVEMARIQAAKGRLLIEKQDQINDQLLRSNQAANDKLLAAFDARLDRIEKLKSGEYVSRRALGLGGGDLSSLYGNIVGIGTSYARGQQQMMGRSPIQVFNDITSTFNRDLRRSGDARIEAERQQRDRIVRELGAGSQKLRAALERIPMGKMTTTQVPGAGEDLSAYIKRIEASTRGLEGTLTGFGKKTTNELRQARQAFVLFRDELDPTTASFKRLEKESIASIERIDKELERRQRGRRRLSGMQMTQAAGAAISGGIFGGPEGFLGGAIGAIGGVGGAFAGAAIGAQVGGLRRTLGGYSEYAAQIERLKIALEGIAGPQEEYNRALAAANSVTKDLNVPQEVAIQGITRLTAAVKGAGGGVADAELAFKNINSAIIATGGGAEQVEGAVTALVQIFSKGKVSAEEINQIAERLPGTFNKIAAASGRTGPELTKALQDGKVGLNDLMKFLVSLGDEYGALALKIAASSENAGARLQIAYNNMRIEVGKALQPIGAEFQDAFTEFIEDITPALVASLPVIAQAFKTLAQVVLEVAKLISTAFSGMFGEIERQGKESSERIQGLFRSVGNFFSRIAKFMSQQWQFRIGEIIINASGGNAQIKKIIKSLGDFWKETVDFMSKYWGKFVEYAVNAFAGALTGPVQIILQKAGINLGKIAAASVSGFGGGPSAPTPTGDTPDLPIDLTDFPGPDVDESGGSKKAARDAEREAREIASLKRSYDALFANRQILTIQMQEIDAARDLKKAQNAYNQEAVDSIKLTQSSLQFEKQIVAARNEYNAKSREIAETLKGEKAAIAEFTAQEQLRQKLAVALGEQMGRVRDFNVDITKETKEQNEAIQQQLVDRQRQLGLISKDEYNQYLMSREERRIDREFPRASEEDKAQMLDLYRQKIDPTPFEKMRQNITQLRKELETLVDRVNQITNAANAIGDAFAQSFVNAISGATTAKQALADFFQSVGSYFLDMAKQIIAQMIQIAILNSVVKLLPGLGSGGGPNLTTSSGVSMSAGTATQSGFDMGSSLAGMFKANGGPVNANKPYIVGERGPELMVPSSSGMIMPADIFAASRAALENTSAGSSVSGDETEADAGYATTATRASLRETERIRENRTQLMMQQSASERRYERERIEQMASTPGKLDIKYESQVINNVEYVTRDQAERMAAQSALRGRELALGSLQNSVKTRKRVGIA